MIAFQVDTSGVDELLLRVTNLPDLVKKPITDALRVTAEDIRADAAASISRVAPRRRPPHQGVGQPPFTDTGALLRSLKVTTSSRKGGLRAYTGAYQVGNEFYGFMLESGTRKMRPRPFLVPAAKRHLTDFVNRVQAAVQTAISQSY
jgi:HK97 gp10 family phage protein